MINDGVNNVPDKTIAIFRTTKEHNLIDDKTIEELIKKSPKKRDWFTPHFYRCLPLTIGNQYGFYVTSQYNFSVEWDGRESPDAITIYIDEDLEVVNKLQPHINTHFGSGILTINPPYTLRTPPGINLMTINPPNFIIPNITVMTGVIECDNIRRNFTFNLKIQTPNIKINFPKGSPLAGFIPVPRYFCDKFELKCAEDIFTESIIQEEVDAVLEAERIRGLAKITNKHKIDKTYFQGKDAFGNKFKDHQGPSD